MSSQNSRNLTTANPQNNHKSSQGTPTQHQSDFESEELDPPSPVESALKSALKSYLGESDSESSESDLMESNPLSGVGFLFIRVD